MRQGALACCGLTLMPAGICHRCAYAQTASRTLPTFSDRTCRLRVPVQRAERACWRRLRIVSCAAADDNVANEDSSPAQNALSATIKRKMRQLQARMKELGTEALEEQLQTAVENAERRSVPDFRLTRLASDVRAQQGRAAIIAEVRRGRDVSSPQQLAEAARRMLAAGADAVAVPTDSEATPTGPADLFAVCRSVQDAPVLVRDWIMHPLQIVDAKEAGAAGLLGIITSVTGSGTAVLSSFASALGLEAPVEIVNKAESDAVEQLGCPFIAVNLSVGLSLSMPSIATKIAEALVQDQPFGNMTLVGVRSIEEAKSIQAAGADCLFLRADFVEQNVQRVPMMLTADSGIDEQEAVLEELLASLTDDQ